VRLNREIKTVMGKPEVKDRFAAIGTDASTSTPEELGRFVADEVVKIQRIADALGEQPK
jgi:tripartite-type tricarboxylate transporter receptor subunit TctC